MGDAIVVLDNNKNLHETVHSEEQSDTTYAWAIGRETPWEQQQAPGCKEGFLEKEDLARWLNVAEYRQYQVFQARRMT